MTEPLALVVDTADPTPPFEQLRRQIESMIESGVLASGQRLPALRHLAADLGLAVGTVARTYRELEAAGFITARRGGGTRVAATAPSINARQRRAALREQSEQFTRRVRQLGVTDEDIRAAVDQALSQ